MIQTFLHMDYRGSFEYDAEDHILHGKILGIRDLVLYEGNSVEEVEQNFKDAVDEYIDDCQRYGRPADAPHQQRDSE